MNKGLLFVFVLWVTAGNAQFFNVLYNDSCLYEFRENIEHPAVKPCKYSLKDTFVLVSEYYSSVGFSATTPDYLVAAGVGAFYSKSKFSSELFWVTGFYKPDEFAKAFFDTTGVIPTVGRSDEYKNFNFFSEPRFSVTYSSKYIDFSFGRDKFSLGESYYSLLRSGYSPATAYAEADVDVWKIKYVYRIDLLHNPDLRLSQQKFGFSYNFTHFFDFAIFDWMNLTMFETAVQDPIDSLGARRGLDINYLNPVAFFRAVDLSLGSPDNILLGLGGSIRLKKSLVLYGYGILDEMLVSHLIAGDGYWGLKYGLQAGAKLYVPFVKGLFLQGELSTVRPYTFSHANPVLAYGNLYHPLGHPLGANFYQALALMNYSTGKLRLKTYASYSVYGQDDSLNYGGNVFLSYLTRAKEFDVYTSQGVLTKMIYGYLQTTYRFERFNLGLTVGVEKTQLSPVQYFVKFYVGTFEIPFLEFKK